MIHSVYIASFYHQLYPAPISFTSSLFEGSHREWLWKWVYKVWVDCVYCVINTFCTHGQAHSLSLYYYFVCSFWCAPALLLSLDKRTFFFWVIMLLLVQVFFFVVKSPRETHLYHTQLSSGFFENNEMIRNLFVLRGTYFLVVVFLFQIYFSAFCVFELFRCSWTAKQLEITLTKKLV